MVWASADGLTTVEHVRLYDVPRPKRHYDPAAGDGEYLLVRRHGRTVAFARSVAEVAACGVDLAGLAPASSAAPLNRVDRPTVQRSRARRFDASRTRV